MFINILFGILIPNYLLCVILTPFVNLFSLYRVFLIIREIRVSGTLSNPLRINLLSYLSNMPNVWAAIADITINPKKYYIAQYKFQLPLAFIGISISYWVKVLFFLLFE